MLSYETLCGRVTQHFRMIAWQGPSLHFPGAESPKQAGRQAGGQADRQADRQAGWRAGGQADRYRLSSALRIHAN